MALRNSTQAGLLLCSALRHSARRQLLLVSAPLSAHSSVAAGAARTGAVAATGRGVGTAAGNATGTTGSGGGGDAGAVAAFLLAVGCADVVRAALGDANFGVDSLGAPVEPASTAGTKLAESGLAP